MAPQKKGKSPKSKDNSTVTTLHKFFASPAAGPSSKTPKSKTAATPSTRSHKEIIVIEDSDSDVEVEVVRNEEKRKRRRSASSSDVELLDAPIKRANVVASAPPVLRGAATESTLSLGKPPALLASGSTPSVPMPERVKHSVSFGAPSALLGGSRSSVFLAPSASASASTSISAVGPSLAFGKPSSLLGRRVSTGEGCPSPAPTLTEMDFGGGEDEWGMGDDEMQLDPEEEDDDEATQIDDPPVAQVSSCPLCQKAFGDLSQKECEDHVNACLDADSGPKPGSSKTPLKRLSSLPVPSALPPRKSNGANAFSVLMTSRTEEAVWTEATTAEASRATKNNRRKAPFYKVMQGMPIAVDAFRYGNIPGVTAYFLTHAHSDHYTNLSSSWKHGPIYCSEGTANLIIHMLSVDKKWVHPMPMDVATVIPHTGGVHVTLIEANHCPGSCLFLFEGPQTVNAGDSAFKSPFVGSPKFFRYLHCGDFRASPQHTMHPAVKGKHMDHVYLDTTYLDLKYTFPPQPLVISACAELAKHIAAGKSLGGAAPKMDSWLATAPSIDTKGKHKAQTERILMVVGTYSVGKERIVKAVAQAVNSKIYCDPRKAAILRCEPDPELHALLTTDPLLADVHILPLGMISLEKLEQYLMRFKGKFTKVVGFRPTGWTYRPAAGAAQSPTIASVISHAQQKSFTYANLRPSQSSSTALQLFPVPYSEHSSFFELTCFALSLQWGRMIATVNVGSERSRAKMARWIQKWEAERKKRKKGEMVPHRRDDYW
ncbi:DNA cross-link repair protein pso2/snm1 [Mycena alexandri]|uniref:DNA cross-link repair protein pso2/snm1 n=1 Tax=Mycena alexandri TaxID=1745969 RepID=A0AAD6SX08_9AGAR|nr:DNA cross-link repair protein pso2/snm1 [Mycena alexandri]